MLNYRKYILVYLFFVPSVWAAEVEVSGFGSIVATTSDSERLGYRNDVSQDDGVYADDISFKPHSNLGLQLDIEFSDRWDAVFQWLIQEQEETALVDYTRMAFVRYSPTYQSSFRLGRMPINLFQHTEFRDIGIASAWISVPSEVYGLVPNRYMDGVDWAYRFDQGTYLFGVQIGYGQTEADFTSEKGTPIAFEDLLSIEFNFRQADFVAALRHSRAEVSNNNEQTQLVVDTILSIEPFWPGAVTFADQVDFKQHDASYSSLYAGYDGEQYSLSGELARIDSSSLIIDDLRTGYVNFSYRADFHTFYYVYAFTQADRYQFDQGLPPVQPFIDVGLVIEELNTFFRLNQTSHSIGWRWDVKENLALKSQFKYSRIDAAGSGLWNVAQGFRIFTDDENVSTLSVGLSFSF